MVFEERPDLAQEQREIVQGQLAAWLRGALLLAGPRSTVQCLLMTLYALTPHLVSETGLEIVAELKRLEQERAAKRC